LDVRQGGTTLPGSSPETCMVKVVRQLAVRTLSLPGVVPMMRRWNRDVGIIFMLHRFAWPERAVSGQDPEVLRAALAFLRRHRYRIVSVSDLLEWARSAERSRGPLIAFTLDDGYADQAHVAAPLLAEFDAPATIFPTTGFLDGDLWMWWDRLRFLLDGTERRSIPCPELMPPPEEAALTTPFERGRVYQTLDRTMKRMSLREREERLAELSKLLDVNLPARPPPEYAPMGWDDARRCESMGVGFGPHTVSHPTLACEREARVRDEVSRSWERVREELAEPVPIFCYPNGRFGDFGRREARIIQEAGLAGALTAEPGYVRAARNGRADGTGAASPFELPRYSLPDLHRRLLRIVTGLSTAGHQQVPPAAGPPAPPEVEPGESASAAVQPDGVAAQGG
jgi:peptidoglycan/xylan/chitin deacetylase (PgdA/CDA1 family)